MKRLQLSYKQSFEQMYLQLKHHRKGRDVNIVPKVERCICPRLNGTFAYVYKHDLYDPVLQMQ